MKLLKNSTRSFLLLLPVLFLIFTCTQTIAETDSSGEKQAKTQENKVTFNFVDVDIATVVKFISDITKKNFVFDERVKGTITIIAPSKLSVDEAFSLFTSVLELKGFTIIQSGKVYKIIPIAQAKQLGTEIVRDETTMVSDTYITRLIPLHYISSANAVNFLQPIISKNGYIASFGPSNMLMIVDSVTNIEKVLDILGSIDKPGVEEPEIVLLQHANADDVAKIISEAYSLGDKARAAGRTTRPVGAGSSVSVGEEKATVFADTRLNAIVLLADKQEREAIKRIIALLDIPLPEATSKINVYFLENADATELAEVLEDMLSGTAPQKQRAQAGAQPARTPFEPGGEISITADNATNSLVIVASPADYRSLLSVIKQLDRRRMQVYVEAMIVEASINDLREIGAKWRVTAEKDGEPVFISGFGTIDAAAIETILTGLSGITLGGMGNFLDVPISTVDENGNVTSSTLTIPGFAGLFALNEFEGAINVLSTPQILTSDNQEAEIVVGENVPFITRRESDPTRTVSVFSTVERKDVGIILRLTPQITQGDYVRLEIYQEISAIIDQSEVVDISVGPSTTKRSTKTTVVVQDNQTVVIGGLMEERLEEKVNKVPLLGDIPLLGWLFKNKTYEKKKVNLFVFLSPHVIENAERLAELTEEKKTEYARAEDKYVRGEALVKFKGAIPDERVSEILSAEGASILKELKPKGLYLVRLKEKEDVKESIEKFTAYEEVEYAEPNYILTIQ
jgi:general secretion pathway protein D